jgi:hypothetical protein
MKAKMTVFIIVTLLIQLSFVQLWILSNATAIRRSIFASPTVTKYRVKFRLLL